MNKNDNKGITNLSNKDTEIKLFCFIRDALCCTSAANTPFALSTFYYLAPLMLTSEREALV